MTYGIRTSTQYAGVGEQSIGVERLCSSVKIFYTDTSTKSMKSSLRMDYKAIPWGSKGMVFSSLLRAIGFISSTLRLVSHILQFTVECVTQCYRDIECSQGYNLRCGLIGCTLPFVNDVWFYIIRRHFKSFSSIR